jgi:hypothetical protein
MLPLQTILHPTDSLERSAVVFQDTSLLLQDKTVRLGVRHVGPLTALGFGEALVPAAPRTPSFPQRFGGRGP